MLTNTASPPDSQTGDRNPSMGHDGAAQCVTQHSATVPDWSREACGAMEWNPGRRLLRAIRAYQAATQQGGAYGRARAKIAVLEHRFWSVVTGADIPLNARYLGGGLSMPHPIGIVMHPEVRIGPNCLIFQNVTLGTGSKPGLPTLQGHVDVGAGAKILGGITIGEHAVIGANAVVLRDIPPGAHAIGVPADVYFGAAR